jgi:6-phosphogluconolactonase
MPDAGGRDLVVLDDAPAVAHHTAAWLLKKLRAVDERAMAIGLSGGSTPRTLYALLVQPDYRNALPWQRIHWFWSDERFVPPTDERSNYNMARELFLEAAPIPRDNIHPIPTTSNTPVAAAQAYEETLMRFYGARGLTPDRPLFDVILLGLGEDGHMASLFPGSPALKERSHWVAGVPDGKPEARITLTYPALESSRDVVFLVTGAAKRTILETILGGASDLPAARLRPVGRVHWFVDRAAAPARPS